MGKALTQSLVHNRCSINFTLLFSLLDLKNTWITPDSQATVCVSPSVALTVPQDPQKARTLTDGDHTMLTKCSRLQRQNQPTARLSFTPLEHPMEDTATHFIQDAGLPAISNMLFTQ